MPYGISGIRYLSDTDLDMITSWEIMFRNCNTFFRAHVASCVYEFVSLYICHIVINSPYVPPGPLGTNGYPQDPMGVVRVQVGSPSMVLVELVSLPPVSV